MAIFLSLTCPPFPLLITSDLQMQAFFKLCQQAAALEDDQPQKGDHADDQADDPGHWRAHAVAQR